MESILQGSVDARRILRAARRVMRGATLMMARLTERGGLDGLVAERPRARPPGPFVAHVDKGARVIFEAVSGPERLDVALKPAGRPGFQEIVFAGLKPGNVYAVKGGESDVLVADPGGEATMQVFLEGRLDLQLSPMG